MVVPVARQGGGSEASAAAGAGCVRLNLAGLGAGVEPVNQLGKSLVGQAALLSMSFEMS